MLCFALGLLALYPEEQEILYQHIKSVLTDGRIPVCDAGRPIYAITHKMHPTTFITGLWGYASAYTVYGVKFSVFFYWTFSLIQLSVLYETLRMFPPVSRTHAADVSVWCCRIQATGIPKKSAEDTFLTIKNAQGARTTIPVPAGTNISLSIPGLHYNRKTFFER